MDPRFTPITSFADVMENEKIRLPERNLPKNTYDILKQSALTHSDKMALRFLLNGSSSDIPFDFTYAKFFARVNQAANAFFELGVGKDDAVSILLPNVPQHHFARWGAEAIGIANPIDPSLKAEQIIEILNTAKSKVLITVAPLMNEELWIATQKIIVAVPTLVHILTVNLDRFVPNKTIENTSTGSIVDFDDLLDKMPAEQLKFQHDKKPEDKACYFHTEPSAGNIKIVIHSHSNLVFSAWSMVQQLSLTAADNMHCGFPMYQVNGSSMTGLVPLLAGGAVILAGAQGYRDGNAYKNFWPLMTKYEISSFMAVPKSYSELIKNWRPETNIQSLKHALCISPYMANSRRNEFAKLTNVEIIECYGSTETGGVFSMNLVRGKKMAGTIGVRFPYTHIAVVKLKNSQEYPNSCSPGEIGVFITKGPHVFQGYLPEQYNAEVRVYGGYYNTGEAAQQEANRYTKILGRTTGLIKLNRGAHQQPLLVFPPKLEEIISQHPAVKEAAIVSKPNIDFGELPVVYVTLNPGLSTSVADTTVEISDFINVNVAERNSRPRNIFVIDSMPMIADKIFKLSLRLDAITKVYTESLLPFKNQGIQFTFRIMPTAGNKEIAIVNMADDVSLTSMSAMYNKLKEFNIGLEIIQRGQKVFSTVNPANYPRVPITSPRFLSRPVALVTAPIVTQPQPEVSSNKL